MLSRYSDLRPDLEVLLELESKEVAGGVVDDAAEEDEVEEDEVEELSELELELAR